eukprot:270070_1
MPLPRPDPSTIGKGWLYDISPSTIASDRIFTTFGCFFSFGMLAYLIWRNNLSATRSGEVKLSNYLWWAALAAIITFGLNQLSGMFVVFPWVYDGHDCMALSIINTWLYFGSKFFLWLYGILRLHDVFNKSGTLAYNVCFLRTLVIIFALECIVINVLHILFDDAKVHHGLCVVYTADFIPGVMGSIDVLTNIFCLVLFLKKMCRLQSMISNVHSDDVNTQTVELAYIIQKFTVLTGFSALSTILLGASVAVTPMLFTMLTIDTIINISCLLLFDKRFDHVYQLLCCCCANRMKFDEIIQKLKEKAVKTVDIVTNHPPRDHEPVASVEKTATTQNKASYARDNESGVATHMVLASTTDANQLDPNSQVQLSTIGDAPETVTGYDMESVIQPEETVDRSSKRESTREPIESTRDPDDEATN